MPHALFPRRCSLAIFGLLALVTQATCGSDDAASGDMPPEIAAVFPPAGAADVAVTAVIQVAFSESLRPVSVSANNVVVSKLGALVPGTVAYDEATSTVTFTPSAGFAYGATYSVTVTGVQDARRNALAQPYTWSFTTFTSTPAVMVTSHGDGQSIFGGRKVTLAGSISDALEIAQVEVRLNGATVTTTFDDTQFSASLVLADNTNSVGVRVTNVAGGYARTDLTLEFPFLDLQTFQAASGVYGQADFETGTARPADASSFRTYNWGAALYAGGVLFLPDYDNNRILGFDGIPTTNGGTADFVLGQPTFDVTTPGTSATRFHGPEHPVWTGSQLIVTEYENSRILFWNDLPTATSTPADYVIGQATMDTSTTGCTATALNGAEYAQIVGGKLIVSDADNNRILIWTTAPTTGGVEPDLVLGQTDFTHCANDDDNQDGVADATPTARTLDYPTVTWTDGERLIIADSDNNRVLLWNSFPTTSFAPADVVLGQPDMTTQALRSVGATSFDWPYAMTSNGNQLFIADDNNRVLIWDEIPSMIDAAPDRVLGQADFTHGAANDDDQNGASDSNPTARTLNSAMGLSIIEGRLWVTDSYNARFVTFTP